MIYTEDIFMDSGAWALYRLHVLKVRDERIGKHGRLLESPLVRGGQGDFSFYDLSRGSEFRKYCDSYASFVKKFRNRVKLFANVDAIGSPELTWEIQRFFEEEHGLRLVPVVHHGSDLKWIEKYLDHKHDIIGLGGFARKIGQRELVRWADRVFRLLCPASNGFKPIVRLHGFAATAWEYMVRYPWWSVDSTSWVKYSAYGWIVVPRWSEEKGFRYDQPPMIVNMSWRSPFKSDRHKHLNNVIEPVRNTVLRWLNELEIPLGKVDSKGNEIEWGVISTHEARSTVNLHYYRNLGDHLPEWPWALDSRIVNSSGFNYHHGFGL